MEFGKGGDMYLPCRESLGYMWFGTVSLSFYRGWFEQLSSVIPYSEVATICGAAESISVLEMRE